MFASLRGEVIGALGCRSFGTGVPAPGRGRPSGRPYLICPVPSPVGPSSFWSSPRRHGQVQKKPFCSHTSGAVALAPHAWRRAALIGAVVSATDPYRTSSLPSHPPRDLVLRGPFGSFPSAGRNRLLASTATAIVWREAANSDTGNTIVDHAKTRRGSL
jgi:hypothetical protein